MFVRIGDTLVNTDRIASVKLAAGTAGDGVTIVLDDDVQCFTGPDAVNLRFFFLTTLPGLLGPWYVDATPVPPA